MDDEHPEPNPTSPRTLLEAWAQGDRAAGQTLLDRHFDRLFRFFELSVPGMAEDLIQDTLIAALEGRDRYRGDASFGAFLMGIARNKVYMHWRTRGRRPAQVDIEDVSVEALGASPSSIIARRDDEMRLLVALRKIPLRAQLMLQMHYWDELSGPDLALAFELPEGTVRSRLRRAKQLLRDALSELNAGVVMSDGDDFDRWVSSVRESLHR